MAKTFDLFPTRFYRAEFPKPAKLNRDIEAVALSLAMDDRAGLKWSEKHGYPGYTSYASLNDLAWRFPEFARLESLNCGKPYARALGDEIPAVADCFELMRAFVTFHVPARLRALDYYAGMLPTA